MPKKFYFSLMQILQICLGYDVMLKNILSYLNILYVFHYKISTRRTSAQT